MQKAVPSRVETDDDTLRQRSNLLVGKTRMLEIHVAQGMTVSHDDEGGGAAHVQAQSSIAEGGSTAQDEAPLQQSPSAMVAA